MAWDIQEALEYYRSQGAPGNQSALISLLKEIQEESGGSLPREAVSRVASAYGVKETFLLAVIKKIPSLRLAQTHCLELCCGPNCSKRKQLASFVRKTYGDQPEAFTVKYTGCMRMCGKGPNIKWNGTVYNGADEALIRSLVESAARSAKKS